MGIESDQLVYDYLSRVGDLAQATTLTAAERARLVTGLRQAIDDRRGGAPPGSQRAEKASVQKILTGIGSPADVVRQAVHGGVPETVPTAPAGAGSGSGSTARTPGRAAGPSVPAQPSAPPVGDGYGSYGGGGTGPEDWWRAADDDLGGSPGEGSPLEGASIGELPGWRAVYEADFLDPDADERAARIPVQRLPDGAGFGSADADGGVLVDGADGGAVAAPRWRRLLLRRPVPALPPDPGAQVLPVLPRAPLPLVETLAALVLTAAAVLGLWYVALLGWFFAYSSRRLGQRVSRTAGLWLPLGLAVVAGVLLYSRAHGQHSGQPETNAAFQSALHTTVSLWLRGSAAASAAFLAWRIARRR
jgi:hypothetical protein